MNEKECEQWIRIEHLIEGDEDEFAGGSCSCQDESVQVK